MQTEIAIIGAGPAGLFLALMLHESGIESVVIEHRTEASVRETLRAGLLEQGTVDVMRGLGIAARMERVAHVHDGFTFQRGALRQHLDIVGLTGGKRVTLYPQHEVLRDLLDALEARGIPVRFEVRETRLHDIESERPSVSFTDAAGVATRIDCRYVAGCDGFHGPSRRAIPTAAREECQIGYPFGWLGILVEAPPSWPELIYCRSERGFALLSTRTATVQRLYLQCDAGDDIAAWSDDRIWGELNARLRCEGWTLTEGRIVQRGIVPMRSFVCETMRHGRLCLAGDAAHIVPPTGAKGLNLAVGDVVLLARALEAACRRGDTTRLDGYAAAALRRVWKAERFSWQMTTMLHPNPHESAFEQRVRAAELDYVMTSRAGAAAIAENYAGLPFET